MLCVTGLMRVSKLWLLTVVYDGLSEAAEG